MPALTCFFRSTLLSSALLVGAASGLHAANAPAEPAELSGAVSLRLNDLSEYQQKQDWVGALKVVNDLLAKKVNAFDEYTLNNLKWQFILQDDKNPNALTDALPPLQDALKLADEHHFADVNELERMLQQGSQLVFQAATGKPAAERIALQRQGAAMMKRFIDGAANPSPDNIRFYAALVLQLYNDTDFPKGPERDSLLEEAINYSNRGIQFWPTKVGEPLTANDDFYAILLTAYLSQEKFEKAINVLEYLVQRNPQKKEYWSHLTQVYATLAYNEDQKPAATKDKNKVFSYNMRALGAYDRAQALGFLKESKDNEMIVGIYNQLNQYGYAGDRLAADLRSGAIESTEDKWQNCALYYQLDGRFDKAVALLKEASAKFPNSGRLDFLAAVAYNQLDNQKEAYAAAVKSATKGWKDRGVDKTWKSWSLAAYAAFTLEDNVGALEAVTNALKDPTAATEDTSLERMKTAIEAQIEDEKRRAAAAKAATGADAK